MNVGPVYFPASGARRVSGGRERGIAVRDGRELRWRCVWLYRVVAEDPVPLEGLNETRA